MDSELTSKKDVDKSRVSPSGRHTKKQKKGPPTFSDPDTFVTFLIGPRDNPMKFTVHKEVACRYSPVFATAFNSEFIEGQTQTYKLDDTTEGAFRLLVQWLYSQNLVLNQLKEDWVSSVEEAVTEDASLVELWVLSDKLCIPQLQNLAVSSIEAICVKTACVATHTLEYVYSETTAGSALRGYMVHSCASDLYWSAYAETEYRFPKEMLIDLVTFFAKTKTYIKAKVAGGRNQDGPLSEYYVAVD